MRKVDSVFSRNSALTSSVSGRMGLHSLVGDGRRGALVSRYRAGRLDGRRCRPGCDIGASLAPAGHPCRDVAGRSHSRRRSAALAFGLDPRPARWFGSGPPVSGRPVRISTQVPDEIAPRVVLKAACPRFPGHRSQPTRRSRRRLAADLQLAIGAQGRLGRACGRSR